jgi:hypothetical protein
MIARRKKTVCTGNHRGLLPKSPAEACLVGVTEAAAGLVERSTAADLFMSLRYAARRPSAERKVAFAFRSQA